MLRSLGLFLALLLVTIPLAEAQSTRLVRQPSLSTTHVVFTYGSDLWIADRDGSNVRRLTSTTAVESNPHFSADGQQIAFTSNRSGVAAVYVVGIDGGEPTRLTWYPSGSLARGWTPDGHVLYASGRGTAPSNYHRLWTVSPDGGPSTPIPAPWANDGSYAPSGDQLVIDRMRRWDTEWRAYRGGQNTPLVILDLETLEETWLPNADRTTDVAPVWVGDTIFFLSDRGGVMNIWSYTPATAELQQRTTYRGSDVKTLTAGPGGLAFERDGYLHAFNPATNSANRIDVTVRGDFPWAATRWENVTSRARAAAISPTGKRAVMEARGEIFTVPAEKGDARNLTKSSGVADRNPIWSPDGKHVAWFSDAGGEGYGLHIAEQDGLTPPRRIDIGESKLGWEPVWSPDGEHIAFVDDDVRVRVLNVEEGTVRTVDSGGTNLARGRMGLAWSHDSKWLAYSRTAANNFRRITVWSAEEERTYEMTNPMADAFAPSWDRDEKHLYFLASTDVALGSGWANTSAIQADPDYAAYVILLQDDLDSPFLPESDEEPVEEEESEEETESEDAAEDEAKDGEESEEAEEDEGMRIDWDGIEERTLALPMGTGNYRYTESGPAGSVFIGDFGTLQKFTLDKGEAEVFARGASQPSISADGKKMLIRMRGQWKIVGTAAPPSDGAKALSITLRTQLDRQAEWQQLFDEA
ncbi:MAG: protease, partial [Bacteroidota bacterium]